MSEPYGDHHNILGPYHPYFITMTMTLPPQVHSVLSYISWIASKLWEWYVEYLWNYDPKSSWVATIAYAYRVFAIFLITPFALLVLTDVTSYVIARTLGVVDTWASVNDPGKQRTDPIIRVTQPDMDIDQTLPVKPHHPEQTTRSSSSEREADAGLLETNLRRRRRAGSKSNAKDTAPSGSSTTPSGSSSSSQPSKLTLRIDEHSVPRSGESTAYFFSPTEEATMRLSGADVFSPAASRPPSPIVDRKQTSRRSSRSGSQIWASPLTPFTPLPSQTPLTDQRSSSTSSMSESYVLLSESVSGENAKSSIRQRVAK